MHKAVLCVRHEPLGDLYLGSELGKDSASPAHTKIALVLDQEQQDQGQQFVFTTNQLALRTVLFV